MIDKFFKWLGYVPQREYDLASSKAQQYYDEVRILVIEPESEAALRICHRVRFEDDAERMMWFGGHDGSGKGILDIIDN